MKQTIQWKIQTSKKPTKRQAQMVLLLNPTKHLKNKLYQFFTISSKKKRSRGKTFWLILRPALLYYQKSDKDISRKEIQKQIHVMNTDAKFLILSIY